jgi:hypothetical protein
MSVPSAPSFADILLTVILLVPGFAALLITKKIAVIESKFSDFENTVISLMLSLIILIPFTSITGLTEIEKIRSNIFNPWNLVLLLALTPLAGFALGAVLKLTVRKSTVAGNLWNSALDLMTEGTYVLIHTTDGKEYRGSVKYYTPGINEERELIVLEPYLIIRNALTDVITVEKSMGKGILFLKDDIKRIVFYEEEPIKGRNGSSQGKEIVWIVLLSVVCAMVVFLRILLPPS